MEQALDDDVLTHEGVNFKLRVKLDDESITIRIDRKPGQGLPLYETLTLRDDEADWLRVLLMDYQ